MRFHNKERLFKCDSCDKMFHQSGEAPSHPHGLLFSDKVFNEQYIPVNIKQLWADLLLINNKIIFRIVKILF